MKNRASRQTIAVIAAATTLLLTPGVAFAGDPNDVDRSSDKGIKPTDRQSSFGFILPDLPSSPSNSARPQDIANLAQGMLDPNADSENNQDPEMTSVYTYWGQFLDHDLTLDTSPSPTAPVDPTTLKNGRTFKFDLDSVYGGGPSVSPQLFESDGKHFKVQNPNPNGVIDLPRNPDGSAILVEGRNDENEIISQIHVGFLLTHNKFIDQGDSFAEAQRKTIQFIRPLPSREVLPHFTGTPAITVPEQIACLNR
jgi:hypothetical protein